jgi:hypothetical protein
MTFAVNTFDAELEARKLAAKLATTLKEKGVSDWIDKNWLFILIPLLIMKKYSLTALLGIGYWGLRDANKDGG